MLLNESTINEMKYIWKLAGVKSLYLVEGINEVKQYFPLINDNDFNKLIHLDPTYSGGDELGIYGKWIIGLYNNFMKDKIAYNKWEEQKKKGMNYPQPVKKSQEQIEDFDKLTNLLSDFENIKRKAKLNINNIKSIDQLYQVIENTKSQGISTNRKVQRGIELFQKSINKGGKVVFKDNKWAVLVPETLESSVVFGEDTNWCTTASNGEKYNHYLNKFGGKYFINLNLETGDLYQFHFESKQFMDSSNKSIDIINMIITDNKLRQFYVNYIQNMKIPDYILLLRLTENPSEELQKSAIKQDGKAIKYISNPSEELKKFSIISLDPEDILFVDNPTEEMKFFAVEKNDKAIKYIINQSVELQKEAIRQNISSIKYIKNPFEDVQKMVVKKDAFFIKYIKNPTEDVQKIAVQHNGFLIQFIDNPSENVQMEALKENIDSYQYIKNPTPSVKKYYDENKKMVLKA